MTIMKFIYHPLIDIYHGQTKKIKEKKEQTKKTKTI